MKAWILFRLDERKLASTVVFTDYNDAKDIADTFKNVMLLEISVPDDPTNPTSARELHPE